jgi:heat shock protein HtpX
MRDYRRYDEAATGVSINVVSSVIVSLAVIGAFVFIYWHIWINIPNLLPIMQYSGGAIVLLAGIFLLSSINRGRVRWYLWMSTWLQSWVAFIAGLALLLLVWYGFYLLAKNGPFWIAPYVHRWTKWNYHPEKYLNYFRWGAYIAGTVSIISLVFNELIVKLLTGAKRIRRRDECPMLWDAVHNIIPWHARPTPRIYLLPDWGMNAVSFGWGLPFLSAVGATEGLLRKLSQKEVEAVMAHEIGHIINKDMLISIAMAFVTMSLAITGWMIMRIGPWGSNSDSKNKGGGGLALLFILAVGFLMYVVGRMLGAIMQAFVSRQREYAADATSARLVGSPEPLKSALLKISGNPSIGSANAGAIAGFLCTADPEPDDVMKTHPSIPDRLKALDNLSGKF